MITILYVVELDKKSLESLKDHPKPPMAPKKNFFTLEDLKPPPLPPKLVDKKIVEENIRSQVISELKDIFKQRGLISRWLP